MTNSPVRHRDKTAIDFFRLIWILYVVLTALGGVIWLIFYYVFSHQALWNIHSIQQQKSDSITDPASK